MARNAFDEPGVFLPAQSLWGKSRSWVLTLSALARYSLHRLHLTKCPDLWHRADQVIDVIGCFLHYSTRVRMRGIDNCPKNPPAVFAGNHMLTDDPFLKFPCIVQASGRGIKPRVMMRDDFFSGLPSWLSWFVDLDEVLVSLAVMQISRGNVTLGQLRPFINLLRAGGSFLMYPGRTRSRSGTFFEYRDDNQEPGSVAFFLAHAQANRPDLRIAAVPMARSFNPVSKHSAIVFGPPLYLTQEGGAAAQRAAQKAFDRELFTAMGDLVEVNAAQLLAVLLCLRNVRHRPATIPVARLCGQMADIVRQLQGRRLFEPALEERPEHETEGALGYFETLGVLTRTADEVALKPFDESQSLEPDRGYKHRHPLRFTANQIMHLRDVVALADEAARG